MTENESTAEVSGAMLQGADGSLYFIPGDRLSEFRVADEDCAGAREALEAMDQDVSGFAAEAELRPEVQSIRAFQGKLGVPGPRQMTSAGDGIWQG